MTQPRHTADSITSDALDALYEQLDTAQQTELARQLATCDKAFASATLRAARAEARAYKAEAALNTARAVEQEWREYFLARGDAPAGHALAMVRAALDTHTRATP